MTREEVINAARAALEEATGSETSVCYLTSEDKEWLEIAIKALEQEPILDKIRAEIIKRDRNVKAIRSDGRCFFTVEEVLEIIDKYRAEREVKE